jgi:hypothetical protein
VATDDATSVARLRRAGAMVLGKVGEFRRSWRGPGPDDRCL